VRRQAQVEDCLSEKTASCAVLERVPLTQRGEALGRVRGLSRADALEMVDTVPVMVPVFGELGEPGETGINYAERSNPAKSRKICGRRRLKVRNCTLALRTVEE